MYTEDFKGTGKWVLLLRQANYFTIACQDTKLANQVIADINSKMKIEVKHLDHIERYSGVNIDQRHGLSSFKSTHTLTNGSCNKNGYKMIHQFIFNLFQWILHLNIRNFYSHVHQCHLTNYHRPKKNFVLPTDRLWEK